MKDLFKFVKSTGIYFAGTVLMKIITFFLVPIYTTYIPTDEMGLYNLHQSYVTFLCAALYLDIWSSVMRYFFDYKEEEGQKKVVNSGLAIFGISSGIYTVLLFWIGSMMQVEYLQYIYLFGLMQNLQNFFGYLARVYGKNMLYASAGIITSLVTAVSNIFLIVVVGTDYKSLFISPCIGYACNVLIIAGGLGVKKMIAPRYIDRDIFTKLLKFSLPLSVNSVAYWFLTSYCSVAVVRFLGEAENGKYAIARQFGAFVNLFTSCFTMAWQEISYERASNHPEGEGRFYSKAMNAYIQFMSYGIAAILPFIYIIYPLAVRGDYAGSKELVPVYLIATIASASSSFLGNIFTAVKRNDILFYTTLVSSIVSVAAVHILIPAIGIQGANFALLAGFLTNIAGRILILGRQIHIRVAWKQLLPGILALIFSAVVFLKGNLSVNLLCGLFCALLMLWSFRDMIRQILARLKKGRGAD